MSLKRVNPRGFLVYLPYPGNSQSGPHYPTGVDIDEEDDLKRGRVITWNGNEGVVVDIDDFYDIYNFTVHVFWFNGELAAVKEDRLKSYDSKEFLAMLGIEMIEI